MQIAEKIVTSIVGLAILSVILSSHAQTSSVVGSLGTAFSNVLAAATKPVSG